MLESLSRSTPVAATASTTSASPDSPSAYRPMLMPVSTISRAPAATSARASATSSSSGTARGTPRAYGTMQYAQNASQPSWTFSIARVLKPLPARTGSPAGGASSATSPARTSGTRDLSATTITRSSIAEKAAGSSAAPHPVTTTIGSALERRACRTAWRALASASPVTVQVLTTTTCAVASSSRHAPRLSSSAAIASDSTRFTLQPRVRMAIEGVFALTNVRPFLRARRERAQSTRRPRSPCAARWGRVMP